MLPRLAILGALGVAACADVEDRTPDWNYIHAAIIEPNCATIGCHSAATAASNLDLSDRVIAYEGLSAEECGGPLEDPGAFLGLERDLSGNPRGATLVLILRGESEAFPGLQMPLDRPLPSGDIQMVADWIRSGASCE